MLWADVAKGVTIFLVVLNHLTLRHYAELELGGLPVFEDFWLAAVAALNPIRMPLFFLLAGFFAASALKRSWSQVGGPRVLRPYYLFVVWLALHAVFFAYETTLVTTRIETPREFAAQMLHPSSSLWFLYALSLYFATAYAVRSLPGWLTVACATGVVVTVAAVAGEGPGAVVSNLPYFLAGAVFPGSVRRLAEAARGRNCAVLLAAYAPLALIAAQLTGAAQAVAMLAASAVGVALAIGAIALATAALPAAAPSVGRLGTRTLAIYVLHLPVMALLHQLLSAAAPLELGPAVAAYPLLATAAVMIGCVAVQRALTTLSLGWLFDLPRVPDGAVAAFAEDMAVQRRRRIA